MALFDFLGEAPESMEPPDLRPPLSVTRGGALAQLYALKQGHLRDLLEAIFFTPPGKKTSPIVSTGAQYRAPTSREGTAMKLGPGLKGA